MARGFVYLRSVKKSYAEQGGIFFSCLRYDRQPERTREKIRRICREAGGEHERALFAFLTTTASWTEVTQKYHISRETLERARRRFYNAW